MKKSFTLLGALILVSLTACGNLGPNQTAGTLLGGAAGGILGHQIGGGAGKQIATVLGAGIGAVAGSAVGQNMDRNSR